MNGPHDVGGQMGFGPVAPEPNEPVFHADWEKRALGLTISAGGMGHWSLDDSRFARENRHPADYYSSSYYELWIKGLETLLLKHGFITTADLVEGRPVDPCPTPRRVLRRDAVATLVATGSPCDRPVSTSPKFAIGERVRARNINPETHTRLPRYARGKVGLVIAVHGGFAFPDNNAQGDRSAAQHLYTVRYAATELWGPQGDIRSDVHVDAWESYLEPV